MGKIQDPENYYDIRVEPMNHDAKTIHGECRILWLHKRYFPKLIEFIDKLKEDEWKTKTQNGSTKP